MPRHPKSDLTIAEVSELSGLSYSRVHELVRSGELPAALTTAGTWLISPSDAAKVGRRPPANDERRAVMVRVPVAVYERWARAAGDVPVSTWLRGLAERETA